MSFSLIACHQGPLPEPLIPGTSRSGSERTRYSGGGGERDARDRGSLSLRGPFSAQVGEGACGDAGLGLLLTLGLTP